MAELIDKGAFIAEIKNTMPQGTSRGVFLALIDDAPTTTEAEIRAKAIKDFLDKLLEHETENWVDHQEYGITWADLELVAEQLKEE